MKRLASLLFALALAATMAGCADKPPPLALSESAAPSVDDTTREPAQPPARFGALAEPLLNFRVTPRHDEFPVVFEEDGKFGFCDGRGTVILPAVYDRADDFSHWGYGRVRFKNPEGAPEQYQWFIVSPSGKLADYDSYQGFHYAERLPVSVVGKDGLYGLINTEFEEILPLEYELLTLSEDAPGGRIVSYGKKQGETVRLDPERERILRYEPFDPGRQAEYAEVIDLADHDVVIVNNAVVVDGMEDRVGSAFPFALLEQIDFDLYSGMELLATQKGKLEPGAYDNMLGLSFEAVGESFFAVPAGRQVFPRTLTEDDGPERYAPAAMAFLTQNGLEQNPYVIGRALRGDLLGDGREGAVFDLSAAAESLPGYFSAVLYIPDLAAPEQFEMLRGCVEHGSNFMRFDRHELAYAAELSGDDAFEVMIVNTGYESVRHEVVKLRES